MTANVIKIAGVIDRFSAGTAIAEIEVARRRGVGLCILLHSPGGSTQFALKLATAIVDFKDAAVHATLVSSASVAVLASGCQGMRSIAAAAPPIIWHGSAISPHAIREAGRISRLDASMLASLAARAEEADRDFRQFIAAHTKMSVHEIAEFDQHELKMSPRQALAYGLCDRAVKGGNRGRTRCIQSR